MNDVVKTRPSKRRMVLVAIERRDDGVIALHPAAPGRMRCSSAMSLYQDVLDLLEDEDIPTIESIRGDEAEIEEAMTEVVRRLLPEPFEPLANGAVMSATSFLRKMGKRPRTRAPMGRGR
jgi:hypothetical protein